MSYRGNVSWSPGRVAVIASNTFTEAVRQKVFYFLLIVAIGMVASSTFFREFNFGSSELKFIADFGVGATVFFGSILAIVATAQLFFAEIENKTALTILAKPVFRSEFIFGKVTGVSMVLLVFCALMAALLCGVLYVRESALMERIPEQFETGRIIRYGDVWLFAVAQWAKFAVLISITVLIASFSNTNLFSAAVSFFVLIICHLQYLARDAWDRVDMLAAQAGVRLLGLIFPNFQIFNFGDQLAQGKALDPLLILQVVGYGAVYVLVFNALAVYSFRHREI
jgi:ABC-type transport system involved in multi-copper enzyme maturation permease subunit